jgi:hypothetical protein
MVITKEEYRMKLKIKIKIKSKLYHKEITSDKKEEQIPLRLAG